MWLEYMDEEDVARDELYYGHDENWGFYLKSSPGLSQSRDPHYHEAELFLATNGSTSGKITIKAALAPLL